MTKNSIFFLSQKLFSVLLRSRAIKNAHKSALCLETQTFKRHNLAYKSSFSSQILEDISRNAPEGGKILYK